MGKDNSRKWDVYQRGQGKMYSIQDYTQILLHPIRLREASKLIHMASKRHDLGSVSGIRLFTIPSTFRLFPINIQLREASKLIHMASKRHDLGSVSGIRLFKIPSTFRLFPITLTLTLTCPVESVEHPGFTQSSTGYRGMHVRI